MSLKRKLFGIKGNSSIGLDPTLEIENKLSQLMVLYHNQEKWSLGSF